MLSEDSEMEANVKKRVKKHVNYVGRFIQQYQLDINTLMTVYSDVVAEEKLAQLRDIFFTHLPD